MAVVTLALTYVTVSLMKSLQDRYDWSEVNIMSRDAEVWPSPPTTFRDSNKNTACRTGEGIGSKEESKQEASDSGFVVKKTSICSRECDHSTSVAPMKFALYVRGMCIRVCIARGYTVHPEAGDRPSPG